MSQGKKNTAEKEIKFTIDKEDLSPHLEKALKKVQKAVSLPGFRKGKVPLDMVRKHFPRKVLDALLIDYVFERTIQEAKDRGLEPLDVPVFTSFELHSDNSAEVSVVITVWPKVKLANYKKMKVKRQKPKLEKKELEDGFKILKENIVKAIAKEKSIEEKDVADKDIEAYVKEKLNYASMEKMKEELEKSMLSDKKLKMEKKFTEDIENFLLENSAVDVPSLWVYKRQKDLVEDMTRQLQKMGIKGQQLEQFLASQENELRERAERLTKLFVILEEIARKENIRASEEEIEAVIEEHARYHDLPKEDLLKRIKSDEDNWNNIALEIDHNKVFRYLVSLADGKGKE